MNWLISGWKWRGMKSNELCKEVDWFWLGYNYKETVEWGPLSFLTFWSHLKLS